jgi:hypothetical protein
MKQYDDNLDGGDLFLYMQDSNNRTYFSQCVTFSMKN